MYHLDTPTPPQDATWQYVVERLQLPEARVVDTLNATTQLYPLQMPWPDSMIYQGGFDLDAAILTIENRIQLEKNDLQTGLEDVLQQHLQNPDGELDLDEGELSFSVDEADDGEMQVTLDGEPLTTPSDLSNLLSSMLQDIDELPEDWLSTSNDGSSSPDENTNRSNDQKRTQNSKDGAILYNEWDFRRKTYRKNWCVLRELATHPIHDDFPEKTLQKYPHLVAEIRRHFEALRGEDKILKAQSAGDNIDIDALITAYADMHIGVEMTDRLFTQLNKMDRDLAVIFMIDVSGSTKGWINDAERESLILLCQALEILGDQYAIYGFSGMTRNRCEVYKVKTFDQPYDRDVRARISGLRPQDYTRMGVTIRHLTQILNSVDAHTRILITLSDGKPDDYDGYRGEYGIEDTRQALLEARNTGIHPFCITIDTEASDYLPHMYGPASYVVVDEVNKLPLKVADIYRKLTT
ncbi:MAG: VWA domain-containing protein [Gammaproteobacteria bacterium]|nr:VWA domain-containing protein [Gammaproteobacteria bacterium]